MLNIIDFVASKIPQSIQERLISKLIKSFAGDFFEGDFDLLTLKE